jgi:hypothetical protein
MSDPSPLLTIPTGWRVEFDRFSDRDPVDLTEDLLQLRHPETDTLVDLGWFPDGDPNGEFVICVHRHDFHGPKLAEVRARGRSEVIAQLHRLLVSMW